MIEECLVVEIRVEGDACPLADATAASNTTVEAAPPVLRRDGNVLLRFSVTDDEGALAGTLEADDRIRYLHRAGSTEGATYRCLSLDPCIVHELTDVGLLVESIRYRNGEEYITGSVVGSDVLEGVLEAAGDTVGVHIERINPLGPDVATAPQRRWDLTPAQATALERAHAAGYFEVPKAATSAEVANELGISKSAFLERLRRGLRRLVGQALHSPT